MQEPHPIAEILRLSLIVEMGHDILATDEKHPARPFGNRHQLGRNYPIRRRSAFYLTIFSLRRHMSERERKQYPTRSEEHTSELQSLMRISYAVFCLKQKTNSIHITTHHTTLT